TCEGSRATLAVESPVRFLGDSDRGLGQADSFSGQVSLSGLTWTVGSSRFTTRKLEILPRRNGTLVFNGLRYKGYLRLLASDGAIVAINCIGMEDYISAVVTSEMYASFPLEALKAQAIIGRTYAVYEKQIHQDREWDVTDDTNSQAYGGASKDGGVGSQAAAATRGIMLVYGPKGRERTFPTFYHSPCGGGTMSVRYFKPDIPEIPPLAGAVACPYCRDSKWANWATVTIPRAEAWARLHKADSRLPADGRGVRAAAGQKDQFGRLLTVQFVSSEWGRPIVMLADVMRLALGARTLPSTLTELDDTGAALVFRNGHGFGHGVGLCQFGAAGLARAGQSAEQILRYYYPQSALKRAY
ncbi:MAG: SpoIID/LytB domain-containing protein, partial [Phycisphaerae bacterium]|nr:SpoIID/LytB domain-containing protein [Phycisphaerae bacterium]